MPPNRHSVWIKRYSCIGKINGHCYAPHLIHSWSVCHDNCCTLWSTYVTVLTLRDICWPIVLLCYCKYGDWLVHMSGGELHVHAHGCFPELCFFQFSGTHVLVGLRKQFMNNFGFPAWASAADFNNNNNKMCHFRNYM